MILTIKEQKDKDLAAKKEKKTKTRKK